MITLEARIDDKKVFAPLREVNAYLNQVSHKLWVELHVKQRPLAEVKAESLKTYKISARHFNSIRYSLGGKAEALQKCRENELKDKTAAVAATKSKIKTLEKNIKTKSSVLQAIGQFVAKVKAWRQDRQSKKKPKRSAKLKNQDRQKLQIELKRDKHILHQKKRRLGILEERLKTLRSEGHLSLAFGSKKLLNKQHHLSANGYSSHDEWLKEWHFERSNQTFWLGSHEETAHNQNAQYDPQLGKLALRVPEALAEKLGKHIVLDNIFFANKSDRRQGHRQSPELLAAFFHSELVKNKNGVLVPHGMPFSYRIIEREPDKFYLQASFEPPLKDKTTSFTKGAIGIDLNADHIAVAEIDAHGNPIAAKSLPFNLDKHSSNQTAAIFGDYLAEICDQALATGKSIVIEDLDFSKKKAGLREKGGHAYARMLSNFAYNKFQTTLASRAAKVGVEVKSVNPAFSSIIGWYKYAGCHWLSSHEKAAVVIARRGKRFSERLKTHGTREGTASILNEHDIPSFVRERRPRHVWSLYAKLSKPIRQQIRTAKKEVPKVSFSTPQRPSGFAACLEFLPETFATRGKALYEALQLERCRFQAKFRLASMSSGCRSSPLSFSMEVDLNTST